MNKTPFSWHPLSREDSVIYKGIGILLIVLHNYSHWVVPKVGENEFDFSRKRIENLLYALSEQPLELIHLTFSFLGHFGVQLFIFLSAYGLTVAYGNRTVKWPTFVAKRLARLYPIFIVSIGLHALMTAWWASGGWVPWYLKMYALKLSMLSNLLPGQALTVNGPWWFFSFIVQFYLVFHLLNRVALRFGWKGLLVVSVSGWAVTVLINPYLARYDLNLLYTVIGRLPELCLGMYLARVGAVKLGRVFVVALLIIWLGGNWFEPIWHLQSISSLILILMVCQFVTNSIRRTGRTFHSLYFIGVISFPLFALHGVLRPPFVDLANELSHWFVTLMLGVMFFLVSIVISAPTVQLDQWVRKKLNAALAVVSKENR